MKQTRNCVLFLQSKMPIIKNCSEKYLHKKNSKYLNYLNQLCSKKFLTCTKYILNKKKHSGILPSLNIELFYIVIVYLFYAECSLLFSFSNLGV